MTEELVLRELKESDNEDIVDICSTVYGGTDYVPKTWKKWMEKGKQYHTFAAESGGKLLGFCALRLIDEGKTGWLEGFRVHPNSQSKGIGTKLYEDRIKFAEHSTTAECVRKTVRSDQKIPMHFAMKYGFQAICELDTLWIHKITLLISNLEKIQKSMPHERTLVKVVNHKRDEEMTITTQEMIEMMTPSLVPANILHNNWKLYSLTKNNFDHILEEYVGAQIWVEIDNTKKIVSLSVGWKEFQLDGTIWSCTIYVLQPSPTTAKSFMTHLIQHSTMVDRKKSEEIFQTFECVLQKETTAFMKKEIPKEWESICDCVTEIPSVSVFEKRFEKK